MTTTYRSNSNSSSVNAAANLVQFLIFVMDLLAKSLDDLAHLIVGQRISSRRRQRLTVARRTDPRTAPTIGAVAAPILAAILAAMLLSCHARVPTLRCGSCACVHHQRCSGRWRNSTMTETCCCGRVHGHGSRRAASSTTRSSLAMCCSCARLAARCPWHAGASQHRNSSGRDCTHRPHSCRQRALLCTVARICGVRRSRRRGHVRTRGLADSVTQCREQATQPDVKQEAGTPQRQPPPHTSVRPFRRFGCPAIASNSLPCFNVPTPNCTAAAACEHRQQLHTDPTQVAPRHRRHTSVARAPPRRACCDGTAAPAIGCSNVTLLGAEVAPRLPSIVLAPSVRRRGTESRTMPHARLAAHALSGA